MKGKLHNFSRRNSNPRRRPELTLAQSNSFNSDRSSQGCGGSGKKVSIEVRIEDTLRNFRDQVKDEDFGPDEAEGGSDLHESLVPRLVARKNSQGWAHDQDFGQNYNNESSDEVNQLESD